LLRTRELNSSRDQLEAIILFSSVELVITAANPMLERVND